MANAASSSASYSISLPSHYRTRQPQLKIIYAQKNHTQTPPASYFSCWRSQNNSDGTRSHLDVILQVQPLMSGMVSRSWLTHLTVTPRSNKAPGAKLSREVSLPLVPAGNAVRALALAQKGLIPQPPAVAPAVARAIPQH